MTTQLVLMITILALSMLAGITLGLSGREVFICYPAMLLAGPMLGSAMYGNHHSGWYIAGTVTLVIVGIQVGYFLGAAALPTLTPLLKKKLTSAS